MSQMNIRRLWKQTSNAYRILVGKPEGKKNT
jgi:hypothetical protein